MEVYIQSKRIEKLANEVNDMYAVFKEELYNIVICGERLRVFNNENRNINCDTLYTTMHGIEFSIVFGTDIDHEAVWCNMVISLCERSK